MAEIDTRPLESVQAAVGIFDRGGDQSRLISPDTNEEEIAILTKELAACKLQLEVRESQHKQAALEIEALEKAVRDLSDQYERDRARIAQLEAENAAIASRQAAADGERGAMRDELAAARAELSEARASVAFVLREVEAMETRAILERESTRDALARILRLNETVLSSAVAAIRAEEERSLFFQEATLEFFNSDRNLEVVRRQVEMAERMEEELLAKTVEIEYLRSELQQVKEIYVLPAESSDATTVITAAAGCNNFDEHDQVQACELGVRDTEAQTEFTFQHSAEECFVSEIFRNDGHVTTCDETKMEIEVSEDVAEDKQGADVMVQDTTVLEGNSDDQGTSCLDAEISGEDHNAIQSDSKNILAENNQEPAESDSVLPNSTACQGNDLHLQHHEEAKADASFVLESSRDDFQSVHSDAKDTSIAEPGNVAIVETQEQRAEASAAPTSTPREGNPDTCVVATEIVSNHDDEFYTKELEPERGQGGSKLDGYVLVSKSGDGDVAARDKQLDAARAEISDLRFSLEEAVRRAELAEEAKAALERELREELRRKQQHTPLRRRAPSDSEDGGRPAALEGAPPTPARTRSTPPHAPSGTTPSTGALRNARPGGEDMPTRGLTLGKVLNMKYK
ncbi:hypothetical protein SEVIR_9G500100v4 [Setaria viridis]|uniref:Uncharacterized protein n=1 Tax=Setaria viridis TaxID=4556 RepID=A0A4V6D270_SETVI|nr:uncharacterized protein LOC117837732 [Setaria viridis]XP_034573371.1 uncharacterized protein LOC117837732 [Setaria viridis]XP_034573372.1 uncharacterized protein LOC117837732 [Setaria viridis]TKV97525.1 hypothetical protein SEVIR_9G500100v2 [Setaria viridis]